MLKMQKSAGNGEIRRFLQQWLWFRGFMDKAENQCFLAAIIEIGSLIIVFSQNLSSQMMTLTSQWMLKMQLKALEMVR